MLSDRDPWVGNRYKICDVIAHNSPFILYMKLKIFFFF